MDVIDLAVLERTRSLAGGLNGCRVLSFTPFDPSTKRTEAVVENEDGRFRIVKGAPQIVMGLCADGSPGVTAAAEQAVEELSGKGYRAIAVARSGADLSTLRLAGLVSLSDPPRPDSARHRARQYRADSPRSSPG